MPDFNHYAPMISAFMSGPNGQPGSEWRAAHPRIDQLLTQNPNWQPGQQRPQRSGMLGGYGDPPHTMLPGLGGFPGGAGGAPGNTGIMPPGMGSPGPNMHPMSTGGGAPMSPAPMTGGGAPMSAMSAPKPMLGAAMNPGSAVPQMGRQRPMQLPKI